MGGFPFYDVVRSFPNPLQHGPNRVYLPTHAGMP